MKLIRQNLSATIAYIIPLNDNVHVCYFFSRLFPHDMLEKRFGDTHFTQSSGTLLKNG